MTQAELALLASRKRRRKQRAAKRKVVRQDVSLVRLVGLVKAEMRNGRTIADISEHSLNPYTRKHISATTVSNWVNSYTSGSMLRTTEGVLRALGKKIDFVDL